MNTCSVREKAELKALGKMGMIMASPEARPHTVYGIMGCMSQSLGRSLFRELPRLDIVAVTSKGHIESLPHVLADAAQGVANRDALYYHSCKLK